MITQTMREMRSNSAESFYYDGDREGWLIALSQHRESDALERSNWTVITEDVLAIPDDLHVRMNDANGDCPRCTDGLADAAVESMSHWAVGWVEYLLVRHGSSAAKRAEYWLNKLEDYPVANEDHFSELEWNEEWCVRCDRGTREQHDGSLACKFRSASDADEISYAWRNR